MDELVKRLRELASIPEHCENVTDCDQCSKEDICLSFTNKKIIEVATQAADAIEQLNADLERSKEWEAFWEKEANEALKKFQTAVANKPRWIPVTERLPCLTTPVLVTDGIEVDIAWMYGVPPRWITSYTAIDEDKLTHWMPLPQTPKEK